ncbi:MAG: hypothetical protein ACYS26_03350 [Planctomycetota bacterium]|jgi:hypothetical protein
MRSRSLAGALSLAFLACSSPQIQRRVYVQRDEPSVRIAHLTEAGAPGFEDLERAFEASNPGYRLAWHPGCRELRSSGSVRVAFVHGADQRAEPMAEARIGEQRSEVTVGDALVLRPGESLTCSHAVDLLVFETPLEVHPLVPSFVRPDWDPDLTDQPGGCAEDTDAYRRILLTWLSTVGPYVYEGLNAHRVRITDSFSHYHPVAGGFDEFYLVQGLEDGAALLTSTATDRLIDPNSIEAAEVAGLIQRQELAVGDLVYLPRGVVHRGLGGVLTQVITAPGFVPGAEIGVDHHLRAINERLGLDGRRALPFNARSSAAAVVK